MRSRRSGFRGVRANSQPAICSGFTACVVDTRDDRQIDRQALWGTPEPGVGGPIARAVGFDLPEAAVAGLSTGWFTGRAVAKERGPADPGAGEAGKRGD